MGRILVIRGGAIGDFILTLPVLAALRAQFPRVRIEVLGYPHIARLALIGGVADAVHPIEARGLASFFGRSGELDEETAEFLGGFSLIVSFLYDPDGVFRTNVARCTQAQFIEGPHRPDERGAIHATTSFLQPLQQLAIFESEGFPRLTPMRVDLGPGRWLAMHPGSGSPTKNWPGRCWEELVERVVAGTEDRILVLGGEAEGEVLERVGAMVPRERLRMMRNEPLDRVAGCLVGCDRFIGHDSGISHLAAAVGLPCLVLWGPTNPAVWRPQGERVVVLQNDTGLAALDSGSVWEVLQRMPPMMTREPTAAGD